MDLSLRLNKYIKSYIYLNPIGRYQTIYRHHKPSTSYWGKVNGGESRLINFKGSELPALLREQTDLIRDLVTLGIGLFYLLKSEYIFNRWMEEYDITQTKEGLSYLPSGIEKTESKIFESMNKNNRFFFEYHNEFILAKYTLMEFVQKIKKVFPLHKFGFDLILLENLCLAYPDIFPKEREEGVYPPILLEHHELVREWLPSKKNDFQPLLNKHISKCSQSDAHFQRTISLFQNKLKNAPNGLDLFYLKLYARPPKKITPTQIKTIMTRLHAYLKEKGPFTYARKVSYDLILGLQVDLVIGFEALPVYLWGNLGPRNLFNHWLAIVDSVVGSKQSDIFYTIESKKTEESVDILSFLESVWLRPCYFDAHIKLHVPLLNNFTTSRS